MPVCYARRLFGQMSEGTTEVVVAERAVIIEHGRTSLAFADLTDTRVERQLRHERHLIVQRIGQLGTHTSSASRAEYVDPFACMLEIAHVLHHATHPHRHLKCDQAGTHGDVRRGGLWGRDHNELGVRQCLRPPKSPCRRCRGRDQESAHRVRPTTHRPETVRANAADGGLAIEWHGRNRRTCQST